MFKAALIGLNFSLLLWLILGIEIDLSESDGVLDLIITLTLGVLYSAYFSKSLIQINDPVTLFAKVNRNILTHYFIWFVLFTIYVVVILYLSANDPEFNSGSSEDVFGIGVLLLAYVGVAFLFYMPPIILSVFFLILVAICKYFKKASNKAMQGKPLRSSIF